jgi:rubredoxin
LTSNSPRTGASPAIDSIAAEIADLEALIDARPSRAGTFRPIVVAELRARQSKLQRSARQEAHAKLASEIPAEEGYRTAVAEMATVLQGANIEAARAALRSLLGSIPVFEDAGQLYGRIGLNPTPLFQPRNPQTFGGVVAGACFEATKTEMVCFSTDGRRLASASSRSTMPAFCGHGHPLTPENVKVDQVERRWRCRRCGRERAAAFRERQRKVA